jgi:hypothetical protein
MTETPQTQNIEQEVTEIEKQFKDDKDDRVVWRIYAKDPDNDGNADFVKVEEYYYPLKGYGNHIKFVLDIYEEDDGGYKFELFTVRQSWYGTGSEKGLELYFNDYGETPIFMWFEEIEKIENVNALKDYIQTITRYLNWLVDMIDLTKNEEEKGISQYTQT